MSPPTRPDADPAAVAGSRRSARAALEDAAWNQSVSRYGDPACELRQVLREHLAAQRKLALRLNVLAARLSGADPEPEAPGGPFPDDENGADVSTVSGALATVPAPATSRDYNWFDDLQAALVALRRESPALPAAQQDKQQDKEPPITASGGEQRDVLSEASESRPDGSLARRTPLAHQVAS